MDLFKRLFGESLSNEQKATVEQLKNMGFDENKAIEILRTCNWNIEQAVIALSAQQKQRPSPSEKAAEAAISRMQLHKQRWQKGGNKAAEAKTEEKVSAQTIKAEKVKALAGKISGNAKALDTLIFVLSRILKNPKDKKFQQINSNNKVYRENLSGCGPAEQFLSHMGFKKVPLSNGNFEMLLKSVDPALLWIGKSALEDEKHSSSYMESKSILIFEKTLRESIASASNEEEKRRVEYLSLIPKEADPTKALSGISKIQINLAEEGNYFRRHFYSDETVLAIVQWLGSISSIVPDKLISGEWILLDKSLYPPKRIQVSLNLENTLDSMQWTPSAELAVEPIRI